MKIMKVFSLVARRSRAFTLVEIIVCLFIFGLLAYGTLSYLTTVNKGAARSAAVSRAQALNVAKQLYRNRVPSAVAEWSGAADNEERYNLLVASECLSMAPAYASYMPDGYYISDMRNLNEMVELSSTISGSGVVVGY